MGIPANAKMVLLVNPGRLVRQKCSDTPRGCQAHHKLRVSPTANFGSGPPQTSGQAHRKMQTGLTPTGDLERYAYLCIACLILVQYLSLLFLCPVLQVLDNLTSSSKISTHRSIHSLQMLT